MKAVGDLTAVHVQGREHNRGGGSLVGAWPTASSRTETGIMADSITAVAVPWSDNIGALNFFRHCELTAEVPSKVLTTDEWVKREWFGDWVRWDWRAFVAAMSQAERDRLFEGQLITAVAVERRPGPHCRNMAVAVKEKGRDDLCTEIVDFAFRRGDGRTVLVQPLRKKKKGVGVDSRLKPVEPSNPVPAILYKGRGNSDWPPARSSAAAAATSSSAVAAAASSAGPAARGRRAAPGQQLLASSSGEVTAAANAASSSAAAELWR